MPIDVDVVETDAGGRPLVVETTMGDMSFAWDGPVLRREAWSAEPGAGRGVTGSVVREVGAAMLLDREVVTLDPGSGPVTVTLAYGYDADRVLSSVVSGSLNLTLSYDSTVTPTATLSTAGIVTRSSADSFGELVRSSTVVGDAPERLLYEERVCERDSLGRVVRRVELYREFAVSPVLRARRYSYVYSARGFLERATASAPVVTTNPNEACGFVMPGGGSTWTYDAAGNRSDLAVNADDQATVGGREYDDLGHLSARTGGHTYSYDVAGHLRSTASVRMTGGPRPRPIPALSTGATYDYDALGRLVAIHPSGALSTVPEQHFVYRDGLNPVAWSRPSRTLRCRDRSDTLFFAYASMPDTPDLAYVDECSDGSIDRIWRYIADERGSVRMVVNPGGGVEQEIVYDAWGNPTFDARGFGDAANVQPFGYIGGIWDAQTSFWHLGARDYDPSIGRWTTRDPIGFDGGTNLYAYCMNDAINCWDPSGLEWYNDTLHFANAVDSAGIDDFGAGLGDTLTLGVTSGLRSLTGTNTSVDSNSRAYGAGEWSGFAVSLLLGSGIGANAAGNARAGLEFSHWIPNRYLARTGSPFLQNVFGRSILNGNYVTPWRHFLHDPFRQILGAAAFRRLPALARQLDRVPRLLYGALGGAAWGCIGMR